MGNVSSERPARPDSAPATPPVSSGAGASKQLVTDGHTIAGQQWHEILPGIEIMIDRDPGHDTSVTVRHRGGARK